MLLSLNIKNAALIQELRIDFSKGLNTLSGETGAGKSIIIDSLMFALGSKADRGMIRNGEKLMAVEAVFDNCGENVLAQLKEIGIDGDILIIYRTLNTEGKSIATINGRTVTMSMLKEITSNLVDIYSQQEHVSLLKPSTHGDFLDGYGKEEIFIIKKELSDFYSSYKDVCNRLKQTGGTAEERERLIDLYMYQINEIEEADINENEETELALVMSRLSNIEKISQDAGGALQLFSGEQGINNALTTIKSLLSRCQRYDGNLSTLCDRLDSAKIELDDINSELENYIYSLEYDTAEAERTEKRLEKIKDIKRKYGKTIAEVNQFLISTKEEYQTLLNSKEHAQILVKQKEEYLEKLYNLSLQISNKRKLAAQNFAKEVTDNLADLSMSGCSFKVMFTDFPSKEETESKITSSGMDNIEFYMSANKGEPLKPLAKIISGGEMSRFMLALKSILSQTDDIDTLIFDEIDTGISGVTATAVAKKFANISQKRQIIAITHLPQIAAMADANYLIEKKVSQNTSRTLITKLEGEAASNEVSRLIGSADIGEHGKKHAAEMINWSQGYKNSIKG